VAVASGEVTADRLRDAVGASHGPGAACSDDGNGAEGEPSRVPAITMRRLGLRAYSAATGGDRSTALDLLDAAGLGPAAPRRRDH
jgi:hypothetical protein